MTNREHGMLLGACGLLKHLLTTVQQAHDSACRLYAKPESDTDAETMTGFLQLYDSDIGDALRAYQKYVAWCQDPEAQKEESAWRK